MASLLSKAKSAVGSAMGYTSALTAPTRSFKGVGTDFERFVGFLAASIFSIIYVAAPLYLFAALLSVPFYGLTSWTTIKLWLPLVASMLLPDSIHHVLSPLILCSWPFRQIPKYFEFEEIHEMGDEELKKSGKNYIFAVHPHGVFSYVGVCGAITSMNAPDGIGPKLSSKVPTAAASVLKKFPLLKDVLGVFGVIPADAKTLAKQLKANSLVLYVGGMAELFKTSPKRDAVYLKGRKGFIKIALRSGADVLPCYFFGNTTVLEAMTYGPLADLSRKLGVSMTLFWGRFFLPMPKRVPLTYARGRPLGLPHIPEPTEAEIDHWHAVYCERVKELFERYKGFNPDYKHKELLVE